MKFLCDVHISYKVVYYLISTGHEAFHINSILDKWFTSDNEIIKYADQNDLIIISKDSDFMDSFFVNNAPKKLIKINLGNISNEELIKILSSKLDLFESLCKKHKFLVEIDKYNCKVHN